MLQFIVDVKRVPCVVADLLARVFVGKVELVAPCRGVLGDHGLQRAVLGGSREERYTQATRWDVSV